MYITRFQRQYPGLVRRMVMMDIGPMDNLGCLMTAAMGAYYQWWNAIAYLLWRYVPLVGKALGDCMHRVSIRRFKREVWNRTTHNALLHCGVQSSA